MILHLSKTTLDNNRLAARRLSNSAFQAMPISADLLKLMVNKPWGNEYLMYNNPKVEIWNLVINHGKSTSMHCHPNKKTALVVLEGKALFSSLNESIELSPMGAVVLDPGVFHSTQAISPEGIKMLEFETPPMKHDLIRLEDRYGRTNDGYESAKEMMPYTNLPRFSDDEIDRSKKLWNNTVSIKLARQAGDVAEIEQNKTDLAVIIDGSIISKYGDTVCGLVDILHPEALRNVHEHVFKDLKFFTIRRTR